MENKHIVAIDAGSSKISIAVGFEADNGFRIMHYRSLPSAGIHQGRIQNAQQAAEVIQELIGGVKEELGLVVNQAVINLPSYPIVQRDAKSSLDRDDDTMVQEQEIEMLETQACDAVLKQEDEKVGMSVFRCVSQSYSDGIDFPIGKDDIIGRFTDHIEGYYQVFLGNSRQMANIDNTLGLQELVAARRFFMPECIAKMVLDPTDVENGVALVDIGGGVTSVSIFTGGILRYYDSIPFGGRSVTMDIRNECGLAESLAENIKKAFGICCPDKLLSMSDKFLRIKQRDSTRTKEVGVKYLSEIVTARMREIFDAVLYIIQQSQLADELGSGIVLTGGGAMLANCSKLLSEMSGYNVRVGRIGKRFASLPKELQQPNTAGCLGLLYAGRGLNKVWFVTDPEDPRVNAIEEEEKSSRTPIETETAEEEKPKNTVPVEEVTEMRVPVEEKTEVRAPVEERTEERPEKKTPATPTNGSLFGNIPRQPAAPAKPAKKRDRLIDKIGARFNSALQNIMESDGKEEVGDLFGDDAFKNE
ncbi:MAG: rod shape-determining protein [Bacteroidales bacterium]|nr:rod shape-determining protein [Bacteroidales bacterium]